MTKQEVYDFLKARKIWHEITEHPPVYDMAGLAQIPIPYPEAGAKNLFVRDDKKRDYYLITVKGDKRVDLKEFRRNNQTRALSFATAQELMSILGLPPGSVTPLGLLHDPTGKVHFYLDAGFLEPPGLIGVHPNDNTATVWLKVADLVDIIKEQGEPGACGSPINLAGTLSPREYRRGKGASASICGGGRAGREPPCQSALGRQPTAFGERGKFSPSDPGARPIAAQG